MMDYVDFVPQHLLIPAVSSSCVSGPHCYHESPVRLCHHPVFQDHTVIAMPESRMTLRLPCVIILCFRTTLLFSTPHVEGVIILCFRTTLLGTAISRLCHRSVLQSHTVRTRPKGGSFTGLVSLLCLAEPHCYEGD